MDFLSMTAQQVEGLPEAKAQEVLDAWVKAKKAELPAALSQSSSKAHAKLAKKALYRLQSSGVQAVVEPKAEPAAAPASEPAKNEFPAALSMQLGSGERAFFFAAPVRGGGLDLFQGIIHDEFGLAQFGSERSNRNAYRRHLRQLEKDPQARVMLVPFERMKLELGRAIANNQRTRAEYSTEIATALQELGVTPVESEVVIPPLELGDLESIEAGAALHTLFEIEQWLPSEPDLVNLTYRVDAVRMLPTPEEQKAAKIEKLAKDLANELFTTRVRGVYARRLWYTAELVESLGRNDDAARLRAEARRLAHHEGPSRFAEQMFVKVLATLPKKQGAMPMLAPK
jgi:hypothetical protein